MRGKLAKALRRQAQDQTVGLPDVAYFPDQWSKVWPHKLVTRRMRPCTRAVYQALKGKRRHTPHG